MYDIYILYIKYVRKTIILFTRVKYASSNSLLLVLLRKCRVLERRKNRLSCLHSRLESSAWRRKKTLRVLYYRVYAYIGKAHKKIAICARDEWHINNVLISRAISWLRYHTQRLLLIRGAGRFRKAYIYILVACATRSPRYTHIRILFSKCCRLIMQRRDVCMYSPMLVLRPLWANAKKLRWAAWYARKRWYPLLAVAEETRDT